MPEPDELLTVAAMVAAILKLNQQTIRNWLDAGKLPYVRVGRRMRIKRSHFDRLIEQVYSGRPSAGPPVTRWSAMRERTPGQVGQRGGSR